MSENKLAFSFVRNENKFSNIEGFSGCDLKSDLIVPRKMKKKREVDVYWPPRFPFNSQVPLFCQQTHELAIF